MNYLAPKDDDLCSYAGLAGILLALTCLIQHMVYGLNVWILFVLLTLFILVAICFAMLAFKIWFSPYLLIAACVFSIAAEIIHVFTRTFSVVVVLLNVYSFAITTFLFVEGMPAKLARLAAAKRAEKDQWRGKI